MVDENIHYILFDNKESISDITYFFFTVKDKGLENITKKHDFEIFFSKLKLGSYLKCS